MCSKRLKYQPEKDAWGRRRWCAEGAEQLRAKIRGLGAEPVSASSVNGTIGMDDHAILAECERGQHMAKNEYETALDEELPLDVRAMVERQYRVVT